MTTPFGEGPKGSPFLPSSIPLVTDTRVHAPTICSLADFGSADATPDRARPSPTTTKPLFMSLSRFGFQGTCAAIRAKTRFALRISYRIDARYKSLILPNLDSQRAR